MEIKELFPYASFREGQRDLASSVYETCKDRNRLVIEAMSGFGKTAPVLTGSVLAAEEDDNRIIYACRTKRQVFRVMEEMERMQRKIPVRTTYLFAKNDYCLLKETSQVPRQPGVLQVVLQLQRHEQPLLLLPEPEPGEQGGRFTRERVRLFGAAPTRASLGRAGPPTSAPTKSPVWP